MRHFPARVGELIPAGRKVVPIIPANRGECHVEMMMLDVRCEFGGGWRHGRLRAQRPEVPAAQRALCRSARFPLETASRVRTG